MNAYGPRTHIIRTARRKGATLIEAMVSIGLLAVLVVIFCNAFSFSLNTQYEARSELLATRAAGQVVEHLRSFPFDELVDVLYGTFQQPPLSAMPALILTDMTERLEHHGLTLYLSIQPFNEREGCKQVEVCVASKGVAPFTPMMQMPPGRIMVRQSTLVTLDGISATLQ